MDLELTRNKLNVVPAVTVRCGGEARPLDAHRHVLKRLSEGVQYSTAHHGLRARSPSDRDDGGQGESRKFSPSHLRPLSRGRLRVCLAQATQATGPRRQWNARGLVPGTAYRLI